jgi:signal transduction histidine kinase
MLDSSQISVSVVKIGSPLAASTTEAVLLQLFLNLFDNAVFWVSSSDKPRVIEIHLDGDRGVLIFADSGPGFRSDDLPYIFEPFFSGKGDEGRGLGLYIARQLLERHEYSIEVAERHDRIQRGANLVISFVKEDEE